jgi:dolichol-phosphate mannosyltransferase
LRKTRIRESSLDDPPPPERRNDRLESMHTLTKKLLDARLIKFAFVGGSGVVVNMGLLYLLTEFAGVRYFISSVIAIELSILSNFFLNDAWTWRDRKGGGSFLMKLFRYHVAVGATAFLVNYVLLVILTSWLRVHYLVSNLVGIAAGTASNYIVNDLWTFKKAQ